MCISVMGRMQILLDNDVEHRFRQSFNGLKKGDLSKKIQELILKDLGLDAKETKKELKILESFSNEFTKLILKFYNSDNFSILAANEVALEWDKLKQRYKLK